LGKYSKAEHSAVIAASLLWVPERQFLHRILRQPVFCPPEPLGSFEITLRCGKMLPENKKYIIDYK